MRLLPFAFAAALLTTPAFAGFDELRRDLALVRADPNGPPLTFHYAAPVRGIATMDTVMPMDVEYGRAMFEPGNRAATRTGVDFRQVEGVFEIGEPPNVVRIIHGPSGFAGAAPSVLAPPDYTTSSQGGFTILSYGEDGAMNFRDRRIDDPFAGRLGRSYRLAIGGPYAIVATTDAAIAGAIADFNSGSCEACTPWREMLDAVDAAAGWAGLEGAIGFSGPALQSPAPAQSSEALPATTGLAPYDYVLMAMTRDRAAGQLHLAVFFPSDQDAAASAEIISPALAAQLAKKGIDAPQGIDLAISEATGGTVATFTAQFEDAAQAAHAYQQWLSLSFTGSFTPLLRAQ